MEWLDQYRAEQLESIKQKLAECLTELGRDVKIPLNVACSDVMKGILSRSQDSVSAHGYARSHNHMREFQCSSAAIPQLSALNSAISRAIYEIEALGQSPGPKPAWDYMASVRAMFAVPPRHVRFPNQFIEVGNISGYCGEIFVCEQSNVVFNLHAYQDNLHGSFTATDTVSAKSTDPGLYEVWQKLDAAIEQYSQLA